jgi:hypothetical protein
MWQTMTGSRLPRCSFLKAPAASPLRLVAPNIQNIFLLAGMQ